MSILVQCLAGLSGLLLTITVYALTRPFLSLKGLLSSSVMELCVELILLGMASGFSINGAEKNNIALQGCIVYST